MVVFTASDAAQVRLAKKSVSHETYKMLFEIVIQRIRLKAEHNHTSLSYRVPHYMMGRPTIRVHHAARYISEKLRFYGYKSSFREAEGLFYVDIDWSREPVTVQKKPRDVRRPKVIDANIKSNPAEAVRRMEKIKLQLQNTLKRK